LNKKKGGIIVFVSPSGGGKSTMTQKILHDFEIVKFSVSATTRAPRNGEEDGVHYHFLSREEFTKKIKNGDFLEWEEVYNGTMYGTLRASVDKELKKGYFILLDIDVLGALNVKKMYGDEVLTIFLVPPSLDILAERLRKRGTETEETLQTRIERAKKEIEYAGRFDEVVENDDLDTAYNQIKEIVIKYINR
jgi:guanylate kinase